MNAGTNVIYACGKDGGEVLSRDELSKDCVLSVDTVFRAAAQLESMNADGIDGESYVAIIHPYAAYDLMRSAEWVDVHKYADPESIFKGEIGSLGNVRFVKSTEAKIFADESCPQFYQLTSDANSLRERTIIRSRATAIRRQAFRQADRSQPRHITRRRRLRCSLLWL